MTQITENRTNECKQVRKSTVVVYEEAYEEFKKAYAAEYCYCVYILTSPDEKIYIGFCSGNPIKRWQNVFLYKGEISNENIKRCENW